jgi:hypothetical protein
MRILFYSLFLFASSAFAAPALELWSRNMPKTCEFVFEVESDIRVLFADEELDAQVPLTLVYALKNEWTEEWHLKKAAYFIRTEKGGWVADFSLQSMSSHERYLYRNIRFEIWAGAALEERLTGMWTAEFGREFGEACQWDGRASTPFRKRNLTLLPE